MKKVWEHTLWVCSLLACITQEDNIVIHKEGKRELVLFMLAQMIYLVGYASLYAFIVTYMKDLKYSDLACGLVTTAMALTYVIVQPISGYLCDTFFTSKKLLMVSFALAIPIGFLIPAAAGKGLLIIPAVMLTAVFSYPIPPIFDSWMLTLQEEKPAIDYGLVKGAGTIAYGVTCLVCGKLFAVLGFKYMFYIHAGALLLLILIVSKIPEVACKNKTDIASTQKRLSMVDVIMLLAKNKAYVTLMVCGTIYQFAARPIMTFLASLLLEVGGDSSHFGLASFIWTLMEFPVMIVTSKILRRGVDKPKMYAMALFFGFIRMLVLCFGLSIPLIIGTMLIQSLMTGIIMRVFTDYIIEITPKVISSSAAALGSTVTFGCGSVVGNIAHGAIMDRWGSHASIVLSTFMMALALAVFMYAAFIKDVQRV